MKHMSLRLKITLLVGLITTLACVALTANSIISADSYYGKYLSNEKVIYGTQQPPAQILPDTVSGDAADAGFSDMAPGGDSFVENSDYQLLTRRFSIQSVAIMGIIVVISLLLTYWVTGRVLLPLTELTRSIKKISQDNLHERINVSEAIGEVLLLTNTFNDMLERLDEAFELKNQFAANAAHELKTPLTVMKTSLQVLEMDERPAYEAYQEFVADARTGLERLIQTVENLLALTRENMDEEKEFIVLGDMAARVIGDLALRASAQQVLVKLHAKAQVVLANRTLLYRIIYNLVENAIKYNQSGGRVDVTVLVADGCLGLEVKDTGIGMDAEAQKHAFEPFYRADLSRSQDIPGSGLGLSIVRLIADRMNGRVEIQSAPGQGTCVRFWFSPECMEA